MLLKKKYDHTSGQQMVKTNNYCLERINFTLGRFLHKTFPRRQHVFHAGTSPNSQLHFQLRHWRFTSCIHLLIPITQLQLSWRHPTIHWPTTARSLSWDFESLGDCTLLLTFGSTNIASSSQSLHNTFPWSVFKHHRPCQLQLIGDWTLIQQSTTIFQ